MYFLLFFRDCHSSEKAETGKLCSNLLMTSNFALFSSLKFLIKKIQTTQTMMPDTSNIMVFASQIKEAAATIARFSVTKRLFIASLR